MTIEDVDTGEDVALDLVVERLGDGVNYEDNQPNPTASECYDNMTGSMRVQMTSADGAIEETLEMAIRARFTPEDEVMQWELRERVPQSEWQGTWDLQGAEQADVVFFLLDDEVQRIDIVAEVAQEDGTTERVLAYHRATAD